MEEFINALISIDDEMIHSINYKLYNNIRLDESDLLYLSFWNYTYKRLKNKYEV